MLDEADRMLDMGFIHAIRQILKMLPRVRQNLMFSATYSEDIRTLANRMLRDPVPIEVAAAQRHRRAHRPAGLQACRRNTSAICWRT